MPQNSQERLAYDVALSFAGEDRDYVEKVAIALRAAGVAVFYDKFEEITLWGKNLYDHLSDIYENKARFMVMFISEPYVRKTWTIHERTSGQARQLGAMQEYILPARFDDSVVPGLLPTIGYVDLRKKSPSDISQMVLAKVRSDLVTTASEEINLGQNAVLQAGLSELEQHGSISVAVTEAILVEDLAPSELPKFLIHLVKSTDGFAQASLAGFAAQCVDRFDVGHDAVREFLSHPRDQKYLNALGGYLVRLKNPNSILWAHGILVEHVRDDILYNSLITKHLDLILSNVRAQMTAYVLTPIRGPLDCNIDTLVDISKRHPSPAAFIRRMQEWITGGYFDGKATENEKAKLAGHVMSGYVLYRIMSEVDDLEAGHSLYGLREALHSYVKQNFNSSGSHLVGLYHLYCMYLAEYPLLSSISLCCSAPYGRSTEAEMLFHLLTLSRGSRSDLLAEIQQRAAKIGIV